MNLLYDLALALEAFVEGTDPNRLETPIPPKLWSRAAITLLGVVLLVLLVVIIDLIVR